MTKEHIAELVHKIKQHIDHDKRQSIQAWLVKYEALTALHDAGKEVWTAYDNSLKTWKSVCAALNLKPTNELNNIAHFRRFGGIVKTHDLPVSVNVFRLISRVPMDKDRDEELLHTAAEHGTGEVKKVLRDLLNDHKVEDCQHTTTESWLKCVLCNKWEKVS